MEQERSTNDLIFDFAFNNAIRDAVLMMAYTPHPNKVKDFQKTQLLNCSAARTTVKNYIDSILDGKQINSVIPVINETVNNFKVFLNSNYPNYPTFTFGNAQKLVNMTAKYFYMITYENKNLRSNFKNADCPMDGIMVNKVTAALKSITSQNTEYEKLKEYYRNNYLKSLEQYGLKPAKNPKTFTWYGPSWSKIDSECIEPYEFFQKAVRFLMNTPSFKCEDPLAFDFHLFKTQESTYGIDI